MIPISNKDCQRKIEQRTRSNGKVGHRKNKAEKIKK